MLIQIEGRSYRVLADHLSIEEVANLLSLSKTCVLEAVNNGQIFSEKYGNQVVTPVDFVEKLLFGAVDQVRLSSDTPTDKGTQGVNLS